MVKHMILWKLKDGISVEEKQTVLANAKRELEALKGQIDGLLEIKLQITGLASSNADMMLDSTLENEAALAAYQVHPAHQAAANNFVRPFTAERLCLDFEI